MNSVVTLVARYLSAVLAVGLVFAPLHASATRVQAATRGAAAGRSSFGFAVVVYTDSQIYRLGTPVDVTVEYRNSTNGTLRATAIPRSGYGFSLIDLATGKAVPKRKHPAPDLQMVSMKSQGSAVPPGAAIVEHFVLTGFERISHTGNYSLQVIRAPILLPGGRTAYLPPSNVVTFTVTN